MVTSGCMAAQTDRLGRLVYTDDHICILVRYPICLQVFFQLSTYTDSVALPVFARCYCSSQSISPASRAHSSNSLRQQLRTITFWAITGTTRIVRIAKYMKQHSVCLSQNGPTAANPLLQVHSGTDRQIDYFPSEV